MVDLYGVQLLHNRRTVGAGVLAQHDSFQCWSEAMHGPKAPSCVTLFDLPDQARGAAACRPRRTGPTAEAGPRRTGARGSSRSRARSKSRRDAKAVSRRRAQHRGSPAIQVRKPALLRSEPRVKLTARPASHAARIARRNRHPLRAGEIISFLFSRGSRAHGRHGWSAASAG